MLEYKYVFISYVSANKIVADVACRILGECGIPCWIAPRNIIQGKTWAGNIVHAIRDSSLMEQICSEDSNSSSRVANEVDKAFGYGKAIIPFHGLLHAHERRLRLLPLSQALAYGLFRLQGKAHAASRSVGSQNQGGNSTSAAHASMPPDSKYVPTTCRQHETAVTGVACDIQRALEF